MFGPRGPEYESVEAARAAAARQMSEERQRILAAREADAADNPNTAAGVDVWLAAMQAKSKETLDERLNKMKAEHKAAMEKVMSQNGPPGIPPAEANAMQQNQAMLEGRDPQQASKLSQTALDNANEVLDSLDSKEAILKGDQSKIIEDMRAIMVAAGLTAEEQAGINSDDPALHKAQMGAFINRMTGRDAPPLDSAEIRRAYLLARQYQTNSTELDQIPAQREKAQREYLRAVIAMADDCRMKLEKDCFTAHSYAQTTLDDQARQAKEALRSGSSEDIASLTSASARASYRHLVDEGDKLLASVARIQGFNTEVVYGRGYDPKTFGKFRAQAEAVRCGNKGRLELRVTHALWTDGFWAVFNIFKGNTERLIDDRNRAVSMMNDANKVRAILREALSGEGASNEVAGTTGVGSRSSAPTDAEIELKINKLYDDIRSGKRRFLWGEKGGRETILEQGEVVEKGRLWDTRKPSKETDNLAFLAFQLLRRETFRDSEFATLVGDGMDKVVQAAKASVLGSPAPAPGLERDREGEIAPTR